MSIIHHTPSFLDPPSVAAGANPASPDRFTQAKTVAGEATTTSTSSTPAGTITASDFLTLLVTELKNQDPTSDQDPNAYITQLVGVNSLQQLIAINQDLTSAVDANNSTTSTSSNTVSVAGSTVPTDSSANVATTAP